MTELDEDTCRRILKCPFRSFRRVVWARQLTSDAVIEVLTAGLARTSLDHRGGNAALFRGQVDYGPRADDLGWALCKSMRIAAQGLQCKQLPYLWVDRADYCSARLLGGMRLQSCCSQGAARVQSVFRQHVPGGRNGRR